MNITNTIFPNIGNRNKTCHNFRNDDASRMSSPISTPTSETAQQEGRSFISQDSRFGAEYNGVHKINVNLTDAETYLTQPDRNCVVFHESIGNNNTENLLGSRESPSFKETVKGFFTSLVPQTKGDKCKAFSLDLNPKVIATSVLNIYAPSLSLMGKFAIMTFYMLVGRVTEAKAEVNTTYLPDKVKVSNKTNNSKDMLSEGVPTKNTIYINDIDMLGKIGTQDDFPIDGSYELTVNLDAMNFTKTIDNFWGDFNGRNHTISNLKCPLVENLADGAIRNLIISNANIHDGSGCLSALVCYVRGNSTINHIQIKDSQIESTSVDDLHHAGMVTAYLANSAHIENVVVKNCIIKTKRPGSYVGVIVGSMTDISKSRNNTVDRCSIIKNGNRSGAGSLIGAMSGESMSFNDKVTNCSIRTNGINSDAGGAVGYLDCESKIIKVRVIDSRVEVNEKGSSSGIVLGRASHALPNGHHTSISESKAINSIAIATHESSKAGIWVGRSAGNIQIYNNTYSNCTIESYTPMENTTTANLTTANLTTTEPAMIVDGTPFLPLGVLLAGVTVTSIGLAGCFVYSLYNGYQEGKRGRSLAAHPFVSAGRLLDGYKFCTGFQLVATEPVEHVEEDMIPMVYISSAE